MHNRMTMPQLWLVTIGAIFREWNVLYRQFEVNLLWFQELGRTLSQGLSQLSLSRLRDEKDDRLSWLLRLCSAVTNIGMGEQNLVKYGWRRDRTFSVKAELMEVMRFNMRQLALFWPQQSAYHEGSESFYGYRFRD
ncbi:uncharacterized protein VDAG_07394 [Verticillium dahliae VdLs.17]|uniref:Uncharacterized protein n=1 Tax=Verticillium dahliae (strain VdLs.17 / ATCC MYA-4575 / FGSC 10137) TaxID=498257 RepID=G2XAR3_VERDV|nr:uncharacterized protein VDAG_07394 [Verticillium dahliae VdLs.17]EGY16230.1 hypothetical protein VDAG_07394 [Verticillium dahliae VdLs.17]KAH6702687.1 hypothetical protein EV126DRAFT_233751 [Verticillium dahliae]